MTRPIGAFTLLLFASFGLACGSDTLKTRDTDASPTGGQSGASASGGVMGLGGSNGGGSATIGSGGSNAGGSATGGQGGSGGTGCPPVACPALACLSGTIPNPDPCVCPSCASPDAAVKDATADACLALPCAYPLCKPGETIVTPTCGCPTCVPVDAGQPDVAPDAGTDTSKLDCLGLDACACLATNGCSSLSEACYCPYPACGAGGACFCGGGQFIACAPASLTTCAAAKARVSTLCPELKGVTFDGLCQQSASVCITKCLNEVTVCADIACTTCDTCRCAEDPFSACLAACTTTFKL
jgi:hypothetical protein